MISINKLYYNGLNCANKDSYFSVADTEKYNFTYSQKAYYLCKHYKQHKVNNKLYQGMKIYKFSGKTCNIILILVIKKY